MNEHIENVNTDKNGIILVIMSVSLMSLTEMLSKYLIFNNHPIQIIWFRYFIFTIPLIFLIIKKNPLIFKTNIIKLQIFRGLLTFFAGILTIIGLKYITLVEVTAIVFSAPIFMVVFSAILLYEKLDRYRIIGVILGFSGVIIILRPGGGTFQWASFLPLIAALLTGLYHITTKKLTDTDHPLTILLYTGLIGTILSSFLVPFFWITPSSYDLFLLIILGFFYGLATYIWIHALLNSAASFLAPFVYSKIIVAMALGFIVFSEIPDIQSITGSIIIVASGIYIWFNKNSHNT